MTRARAFSLVELLIVVAIIGIVSAIALPTYQQHVLRANRTQASTALMDLSSKMQQYFVQHNSYEGATLSSIGMSATTENHLYQLHIQVESPTTYLLQAIPQGRQAKEDTQCATFTYDQVGVKGITGNATVADCW